ncbi:MULTISPECIES: YggS family pyridoxal phosphate-dependent enzyme [Listeria]|uniref:YggS family pyridoxal phosphate-dependent enzyme n=1 Tax=Listeria TaxID=1637 RepID=UPI000B5940A8|nr:MULTISPECIES: YggS family pyridoxal phosphate-dependent enzyme [Listeria]
MTKKDNLSHIESNIEAACQKVGRTNDVHLVAVTKTIDVAGIRELYELGLRNFGENRADVFLEKFEALQDLPDIVWHFIGSLQTRKVRDIVDKVDIIHSVDRPSLAKEIEKRTTKSSPCFLQINISGEEAKHGFTREAAVRFLKETDFKNIEIIGLMTMAPLTEDVSELHQVFHELKQLQLDIQKLGLNRVPCKELSMGMTNDYMIAIEEGATHIRVGRALVND